MSCKYKFEFFRPQPHKMVKHTQAIRGLLPTYCLSVFDHFEGFGLKGLILLNLFRLFNSFHGIAFYLLLDICIYFNRARRQISLPISNESENFRVKFGDDSLFQYLYCWFNPFVPNAPFLWCFQVVEKGCIGNELVKMERNYIHKSKKVSKYWKGKRFG